MIKTQDKIKKDLEWLDKTITSLKKQLKYIELTRHEMTKQLTIPVVVATFCDCAMPDPIDPFAEVDKDTCRKCNNLIA